MQPAQPTTSLSLKAVYLGAGGLAVFILEVAALVYGLSDGSLYFFLPLLLSPLISIAGIVVGAIAYKRRVQPQGLAVAGIICGIVCAALCVGLVVFIGAIVAGLQGVA
jgi:hypothetical protein